MTRMAVFLALALLACSQPENWAIGRQSATDQSPAQRLEREAVAAQCQTEADRWHSRRIAAMPIQWRDTYVANCSRELAIMRAAGRR